MHLLILICIKTTKYKSDCIITFVSFSEIMVDILVKNNSRFSFEKRNDCLMRTINIKIYNI